MVKTAAVPKAAPYLEVGDVARALNIGTGMVRWLMSVGRLRPAAFTRRGCALFKEEEVERVARERAEKKRRSAAEPEPAERPS